MGLMAASHLFSDVRAMTAFSETAGRQTPRSQPFSTAAPVPESGRRFTDSGQYRLSEMGDIQQLVGEPYQPPSDFLRACVGNEVPLSGSVFAEANIRRLIAMTADSNVANRDWATLLLAETGIDTPAIRSAFVERLTDHNDFVRAEALRGLAQRDPVFALPHVQQELLDSVSVPLLEAAGSIASLELLAVLLPWRGERSNPPDLIDDTLEIAIIACGGPPLG